MSAPGPALFVRRAFDVDCTVRVTCTLEELSAHVELDGEVDVGPGDRVRVHGAHIPVPYGATLVERRRATVTRATWLERLFVRMTGDFASFDLLDVSFTDRRTL